MLSYSPCKTRSNEYQSLRRAVDTPPPPLFESQCLRNAVKLVVKILLFQVALSNNV